ncbi:MAG: diguanylate cyclase [Dehalococcoidales bacterium]|nr:diguanylate cyclase [Dehalococcoidales bacterium]
MNVWALIPLISCLCLIILLLLFITKHQKNTHKIFSLVIFSSIIWCFLAVMSLYNTAASPENIIFWNSLLFAALPLVIVTFYHYVSFYNNGKGDIAVWTGYAGVLILTVLSLMGYVVENVYFVGNLLYADINYWGFILTALIALFLLIALQALIKRYRNSFNPTDRNRTAYLIMGLVIFIIISSVSIFIPALKPLPITVAVFINTAIIGYTVLKYNLPDIQVLFRNFLTYAVISTALSGLTVALIIAYQNYFMSVPVLAAILILFLIFIAVFLLSLPIIALLNNLVERVFFKNHSGYRYQLSNFNTKIRHILVLDDVATETLSTVTGATNARIAGLILYNKKTGNYENSYLHTNEVINDSGNYFEKISLAPDSTIINWISKQDFPLIIRLLDSIDELKELPQREKDMLLHSKAEYLFPLKSRGKLVGILVLSEIKNTRPISLCDIDFITDITNIVGVVLENSQTYMRSITKANTDELTGLYNHRHFHERLYQEIARTTRLNGTFSLIMMDVDLFKSCNDNFGHLIGDDVLKKVGEYIDNSIRDMDLSFRYGGDEFAVILPNADIENAYKVAERIRNTIELQSRLEIVPITVSLGISNWPGDGIMDEEIIRSADKALYTAKQFGRNCTFISSDNKKTYNEKTIASTIRSNTKALTTIYAMASSIDGKIDGNYSHSKNVSNYAITIAKSLKLPDESIECIRSAGLLHDIGKINIPENILNKNTLLTVDEKQIIEKHPEDGILILKNVIDLVNCIPAILHHHENYDGSGYPSGLSGENIPLAARILSVANCYDTLMSSTQSGNNISVEQAIEELRRFSGNKLDPFIVETFVNILIKQNTEMNVCDEEKQIIHKINNEDAN